MDLIFYSALGVLAVASFAFAPRAVDADGFFRGQSGAGAAPSLLTLTFSQVTTWIFARSLLTAAILGYYYGIAGGLAYTAYYLSFFTGRAIIRSIRFRHGFDSVQDFLRDRFGTGGVGCYNVVVGVRLLSEVFANLLVIGIIFGETGTLAYGIAITMLAMATLAYSMLGGLRASLKTDVFQMTAFLAVFGVVIVVLFTADQWSWASTLASSPMEASPGWILLAVAGLQIWSYPLHDPVMMDRGFIADRDTTLNSFTHAGWISMVCILGFSLLGVFAGLNAIDGETMQVALARLLGPTTMIFINLALIISAVSTLDSTLSSASKLSVSHMGLDTTVKNGRIAMAIFMAGGLLFLFGGTKDLFSAVAVSGTASMYLVPVIFFSLWLGRTDIPAWSYYLSFITALAGAVLYYVESSGMASGMDSYMTPLLGMEHKYTKLLVISGAVMVLGNAYFALGLLWHRTQPQGSDNTAIPAKAGIQKCRDGKN
ncbi:MAG: sodium:proline symporter [Rhodospirillales bacterium]|jgi:Na+/proline symporter|nr:sodium:proline symporter [Rhodospirillales bacterium]MBT4040340.1 sodium:proline symporter [Rhodospirillales bacterium]MBT4625067.1 sodium:proline symporter [Rhodospirillales bacterium]MBT5353196.1 sodium:proline symporter [Rhodospirillales bacterium]MBT5519382.1 sodium:proline symporter [Rhodospirillales bacterium]